MKISKRTREQAAMLCAIAASAPAWLRSVSHASDCVRSSASAYSLAFTAWAFANRATAVHQHAEAESLLRSGWSPP